MEYYGFWLVNLFRSFLLHFADFFNMYWTVIEFYCVAFLIDPNTGLACLCC